MVGTLTGKTLTGKTLTGKTLTGKTLAGANRASMCQPSGSRATRRLVSDGAIALLIVVFSTAGCGREPVEKASRNTGASLDRNGADKGDGSRSENEGAATNDKSAASGEGSGETNPAGKSSTGRGIPLSARHPIDQIDEGLRYREAVRALDAGDIKRATEIRDELKTHPTYGVLAKGIDAFMTVKRGEFQRALDAAGQLSTATVLRVESYVVAGEALRGLGRWSEAIECLKTAVSLDEYHVRAHQWLGAIYHDTGAMQLSVQHLRKVAELDSTDYRSLRLAGLIHLEYEKFDDAIVDYRSALRRKLPPAMELEVRRELADALREVRQIDEALAVIKDCEPTIDILAVRAECYETNGQVEPALECTGQALALDPDHHRANVIQGRILVAQKDVENALKSLERAVKRDPADHEARFLLGRALLMAGRAEEGQAEIAASTEQKERFLTMSKLHLEAMDSPPNEGVRLKLGELAEALGRPRVAMTWYRAVLGLAPDNERARAALDRLVK